MSESLYDLESQQYLPRVIGRKRIRGPVPLANKLITGGALVGSYGSMGYDMYRAHQAKRQPSAGEFKYDDHSYNMPSFQTQQRDVKSLYGRRRKRGRRMKRKMRRKAKSYRRFKNKVRKLIYNDLGEFNFNFNQLTTDSCVAGQQKIVALTLCGFAGSSAGGGDHIKTMLRTLLSNNPRTLLTAAPNLTTFPSNIGARMRKAVMDCTITNTGATNMELDIYECYAKQDINYATWDALVSQLLSDTDVMRNSLDTANLTALSTVQPGCTPFDIAKHGSFIKIKSVTRIYVASGQATSFLRKGKYMKQLTDQDTRDVSAEAGTQIAKKKLTKFYLFKFAGVPTAANLSSAASIALATNYHYSWNVVQNQNSFDAVI